MKIIEVKAYPLSFRVSDTGQVRLGIGRTVKRDTVVVKVRSDDGLVGWGESHHGRAPGAVANLINTTLSHLVVGMDATDTVGVWNRVYKMQLASHGMGAAAAIGLSGIDMALWDLRGKSVGWPLYRLLGGSSKPITAYAGGISLGFQPPAQLADEALGLVAHGYRVLKLRVGDTWREDVQRVRAVRDAVGDAVELLVDANTNYSVEDVRRAMPAFDELHVGWLEEPFPPHDPRSYRTAVTFGKTPLAAGENHYTRFEFQRLIDDGAVSILQPDLSKTGGLSEGLRIAAMGSAHKLQINPHTSASGLNMAATLHFLASIDNGGFYEADASVENLFRDKLTTRAGVVDASGFARPPEGPGLGVEIDEEFIARHPVIDGPGYV